MAWQVVHYIVGKDILVPSFYATMGKVFELLGQVSFYYDIGMTFYRVFMGVTYYKGTFYTFCNYFEKYACNGSNYIGTFMVYQK